MKIRTAPANDFLSMFGGRAGVVATGLTTVRPWDGLGAFVRRRIEGDRRRRQLRHLAGLDPHLLRDVGVTRAQVLDELRKE